MKKSIWILITALIVLTAVAVNAQQQKNDVDPLVKASAYRDKTVWSYHDREPVPWSKFKPRDYGSKKITFSPKGVRSVGKVPAPGVHPRIFFSPEDLPAIRKRIKEDRGAQEAWKNILSWANAMKLTYDENADYAKPDWMNGGFRVHGRIQLFRIGGYDPKREDYYRLFMTGQKPEKMKPADFFPAAAPEAFRCLIEEDAQAAKDLAQAVVNAVKMEQERREKEDKPVKPGQPPKPSTGRISACSLGFIYDFIFNYMTDEQKKIIHDELVTLSAWSDNYGTFNNAEGSRSNWATFSYWVYDLMAIEGEPGFNDLKFLGFYRGWRNFYNYEFFDSGAVYEGEGKLLLGLDAAAAFDRVGWKYNLEPLTQHPLVRSHYSKFTALATMPSRKGFAIFDILGGLGGSVTTPQDVLVAHYLYPEDGAIDYVYRTTVGDDYRDMPSQMHHIWVAAIISASFATSYKPEISPEELKLPLSFFCGQRALMMTRSSWDKDATFLTMHVRGASGGHPFPDRNGIMLAGKGRIWATIPGKVNGNESWKCGTVTIDGKGQNCSTPGRVVDFVDNENGSFMVGDAKYCWDWIWGRANKNKQGKPCTVEDVRNNNVDTGASWKLVENSFNDFAFTKTDEEIYRRPLKFTPDWLAFDGVMSPVTRQVNTPVLKALRTSGLVRGKYPYALVVDDIQRDALPARYDWNLTLPNDVIRVNDSSLSDQKSDILLVGKASVDEEGKVKTGEPVMLIRILECKGKNRKLAIGEVEKVNLLKFTSYAKAPDFKILLYAFKSGETIPEIVWTRKGKELQVNFPEQKDIISFSPSASGKTDIAVLRDGKSIIQVSNPVEKLNDSETDAVTADLEKLPEKINNMKNFNPDKLDGLLASYTFDKIENDAFSAGQADMPAISAVNAKLESGVVGSAARFDKDGVKTKMNLKDMIDSDFTVSFWIKSDPKINGSLINFNAHSGFCFDIFQGRGLRFNAQRKWYFGGLSSVSTLTGWTNLTVVYNGQDIIVYRDGKRLMTLPAEKKPDLGTEFTLGGNFEGSFDDLRIYNRALDDATVEKIYLAGKYLNKTGKL